MTVSYCAVQFSSVPSLSHVWLCNPMDCSNQASLSITNSPSLLKLIHVHWVGDAIQPSHPLSSPSLPTLNFSQHQGLFQWVSSSHQVAKELEFQLQHQSFQWTLRTDPLGWTGWISLQVQGTLKSLLQHHSSKAPILQCSTFFIVQLLHPYMTTGKTIALTRQNFVGKVMSLLFNMLSRLIITFLPRSKRPLISWLQSPSAVILEPKKIKDLLSMTLPIRTRPSFPLSQSLPSGNFHKPLILPLFRGCKSLKYRAGTQTLSNLWSPGSYFDFLSHLSHYISDKNKDWQPVKIIPSTSSKLMKHTAFRL